MSFQNPKEDPITPTLETEFWTEQDVRTIEDALKVQKDEIRVNTVDGEYRDSWYYRTHSDEETSTFFANNGEERLHKSSYVCEEGFDVVPVMDIPEAKAIIRIRQMLSRLGIDWKTAQTFVGPFWKDTIRYTVRGKYIISNSTVKYNPDDEYSGDQVKIVIREIQD